MVIGIVGSQMARTYHEVRARPLYLGREARGSARRGRGDADAQSPVARQDSLANGQPVPQLPPS
jgi:hypothetical protein